MRGFRSGDLRTEARSARIEQPIAWMDKTFLLRRFLPSRQWVKWIGELDTVRVTTTRLSVSYFYLTSIQK